MAVLTTHLRAGFNPAQSPPPVSTPILLFFILTLFKIIGSVSYDVKEGQADIVMIGEISGKGKGVCTDDGSGLASK
jgi:hypothetical protein